MEELIISLLEKSALVAFSVFALWMLVRSYKDRLEEKREQHKDEALRREEERQDKLMMTDVLREVSTRMAEMSTVLRGLADKVGVSVEG